MKKLRIGVMGCASIAFRSVIPAIKNIENYELIAIASRTQEKADKFASIFNCEAVCGYINLLDRSDIDAIYMPLPTGLHEEWVIKSLERKKHVLVEKSLAINYQSAQRMISLAKEKNLLIMENFMFLYHSQHQYVKNVLSSGEIGKIRSFRSSFGFPPLPSDNFRYNCKAGGGALLDVGAYTIRATQLFLGNNIWVASSALNFQEQEVDIFGGAFIKNKKGIFSEVAFGFDNYYQCNYEIWGSKGKIILHKAFTPKPNQKPLITIEKDESKLTLSLASDDHFKNLLNEFKRSINKSDFESKYSEILNQSRLLEELKIKSKLS